MHTNMYTLTYTNTKLIIALSFVILECTLALFRGKKEEDAKLKHTTKS